MLFTLQISPVRTFLSPYPTKDVSDFLYEKLRFRMNGYFYNPKYQAGIWDGFISLYRRRDNSFSTGLVPRVVKLLQEEQHEIQYDYFTDITPRGTGEVNGITLKDFQKTAVERAVKYKYGIISAVIRSGKTAIIASTISKIDRYPVFILTYGKDLVVQTRDELEKFLGKKVGVFSESKFQPGDIIVTSYNALVRIFSKKTSEETQHRSEETQHRNDQIKKIMAETKVLILDESHCALTKKFSKALDGFTSTGYRIGLSGTPKPGKKVMLELEAAIGPIIYTVPFQKVIESGRITKPVVIEYEMPCAWYQEYLTEYSDAYEVNIVRNELRNRFIADLVAKLTLKNKTCFIPVRKKYHGEILRELIPNSVYVYGDIDSDIRKDLYNRLNSGSLKCIISTVGKLGLNIPNLSAVINAEGLEADTVTVQKMRSLTAAENKEYGLVIDFIDRGKYIYEHSKSRSEKYHSLKGFTIHEIKVPENYFDRKEETNEE